MVLYIPEYSLSWMGFYHNFQQFIAYLQIGFPQDLEFFNQQLIVFEVVDFSAFTRIRASKVPAALALGRNSCS